MKSSTLALSQVLPGSTVRIYSIANLNPLVSRRLLDLGVSIGSHVQLKRKSPLGGPLTLETNGQLFGIRRSQAAMIEVQMS